MTTTTAVVTGANKGIGLHITRQLLEHGWTVWLGSRDTGRGEAALAHLAGKGHPGHVKLLHLDVTSDSSVAHAARTVEQATGLDVLINNAGVAGTGRSAADATADDVAEVLEVNTVAPVRVTHAFVPLLLRSPAPQVINISSGLGSFAFMTDPTQPGSDYPDLAYPVSKAALNMATVQYAKHVPQIRFLAVGPGYTATDLNHHTGTQSPDIAAANVVTAILDPQLPSPSYVSAEGAPNW